TGRERRRHDPQGAERRPRARCGGRPRAPRRRSRRTRGGARAVHARRHRHDDHAGPREDHAVTGGRLMPTYARLPVTLVRGDGCRVWADDGSPYLDLLGGLGALSLGHAHPPWVTAVTDTAATIGLTTNLVTTLPQATLADRSEERRVGKECRSRGSSDD